MAMIYLHNGIFLSDIRRYDRLKIYLNLYSQNEILGARLYIRDCIFCRYSQTTMLHYYYQFKWLTDWLSRV